MRGNPGPPPCQRVQGRAAHLESVRPFDVQDKHDGRPPRAPTGPRGVPGRAPGGRPGAIAVRVASEVKAGRARRPFRPMSVTKRHVGRLLLPQGAGLGGLLVQEHGHHRHQHPRADQRGEHLVTRRCAPRRAPGEPRASASSARAGVPGETRIGDVRASGAHRPSLRTHHPPADGVPGGYRGGRARG